MASENRPALLKVLTFIQNRPRFDNQDILTFAGFLDDAELSAHILRYTALMSDDEKCGAMDVLRAARLQRSLDRINAAEVA